ncbi:MAG: hypothetical protein ACRC7O_09935 [Fimbriiglobus sp.]
MAGVRALAKSPYLRTVRRFDLRWNYHLIEFSDEVAALFGGRHVELGSHEY